jgi:hypothetical protein
LPAKQVGNTYIISSYSITLTGFHMLHLFIFCYMFVGTLKTGYLVYKFQVTMCTSFKSKMKGKTDAHTRVSRGSRLLAQSSFGDAMCLQLPPPRPSAAPEPPHACVSRGSRLLTQGSSRAATCLMTPAPTTRARGSSGTATCHVASAPVSWHRTALGPPCAPWVGAAGCGLLK